MSQLPTPYYEDAGIVLYHSRNEDILPLLAAESFHTVVTDPPAGISFMQAEWDHDKGGRNQWVAWMSQVMNEVTRVLKPGAHGLIWALPRTSHWTAWALEEAGLEVRDRISHIFASGFPKSLDVSKALDRKLGAERKVIGRRQQPDIRRDSYTNRARHGKSENVEILDTLPATDAAKQWDGWGSALKPAVEDWWLCRKPLTGTICENILEHECGALNIDASRIPGAMDGTWGAKQESSIGYGGTAPSGYRTQKPTARYPSNILHDGSDEVLAEFEKAGERTSGAKEPRQRPLDQRQNWRMGTSGSEASTGSAARFFKSCDMTNSQESLEVALHTVAQRKGDHNMKMSTYFDPKRNQEVTELVFADYCEQCRTERDHPLHAQESSHTHAA